MNIREEDIPYFNSRKKKARIIVEELASFGILKDKELQVLEVGCNHGFITYHLSQLTSWKLEGGDINKNVETYKKELSKFIKIGYLDATKMPYKNSSFDIVILNHVIEHIPEWEKAIAEIYRVLKKGGVLYLATPNKYRKIPHPKDRLQIILRVLFRNKSKITREERMKYHSGFSASELESLLTSFKTISCMNKEHFIRNAPSIVKPILKILPDNFHKKRSQTCLFIAKK